MKQTLLPILALALLTQCKKNDPDPASQLPPATQTGANQVGCLLNGQPWVPVGGGTSKNFFIDYDPTLGNGVFSLNATRYLANSPSDESLTIFANPFKNAGTYNLGNPTVTAISFDSPRTVCYYNSRDAGTYCKGTLTVTRLDAQAGIISGTFEFTLAKAGCDTLKVTQGRFDKKL
jgi:hypothetical protein